MLNENEDRTNMASENADDINPPEGAEMIDIDKIDLDKILWEIAKEDEKLGKQVDIRILNSSSLGARVHEKIRDKLEKALKEDTRLRIRIPTDVIGITPDFLEAMFSNSLDDIKSVEDFRRIFNVSADIDVKVQIMRAIQALLLERH
jgi:hypothetical protein